VKFPYPTLARLMSGRSAIIDPGDGELTVPPVLQPVTDIFSPMLNLNAAPALAQDTWLFSSSINIVGVVGAQSFQFPTMPAGRWDFDIVHNFRFTGTTAIINASNITLADPASVSSEISRTSMITGAQTFSSYKRSMLFVKDGWRFTHAVDAGVAGDSANSFVSIYARRVF